jgi:integrase
VLDKVKGAGPDRPLEALADPGLALDVLIAAGPETEAALVGRVLDFLRVRSGAATSSPRPVVPRPRVCVAEAVATFEAGPLATQADGTRRTYRTWTRRLAVARPDDDPGHVTTGDLRDLIAHHVLARREGSDRRLVGNDGAEAAVAAFRAMWRYFVQKGWAATNVAMDLDKPPRPDPNRREIRPEEAVLVRHLAVSTSRDPLLDEVALSVPERLGVRQIELLRVELCDLDLDERQILVWGKNKALVIDPWVVGW